MDDQRNLSHTRSQRSSSSSAVDLTGTPAGLASTSRPPSPTLHPSDSGSNFARRRASWGRVEDGQDPLHLQTPVTMEAGLSSAMAEHGDTIAEPPRTAYGLDGDPFLTPAENSFLAQDFTPRSTTIDTRYGSKFNLISGTSTYS
ncbi:hypothetical protein SERLA73DRAFT_183929, partial [Serpula lacrymans var. lacrymans S7.3]